MGRDVRRRGDEACLKRMKNDNVEIESCEDRQKASSGRIRTEGVAESEEGVGTARPRRD